MHGWQATLLGGTVGFGVMLIFYLLGKLFTRWRNKRLGAAKDNEEALGSGDVTLATILGLLVGWPLIWFNLLMGILLAGIFSLLMVLVLILTRKYKTMMVFIAYGPFFNIMAFLLVFFPKWISAILPSG
jgi:prepilin signal peptidase PulO-like enzyme (type II secretory pathway)